MCDGRNNRGLWLPVVLIILIHFFFLFFSLQRKYLKKKNRPPPVLSLWSNGNLPHFTTGQGLNIYIYQVVVPRIFFPRGKMLKAHQTEYNARSSRGARTEGAQSGDSKHTNIQNKGSGPVRRRRKKKKGGEKKCLRISKGWKTAVVAHANAKRAKPLRLLAFISPVSGLADKATAGGEDCSLHEKLSSLRRCWGVRRRENGLMITRSALALPPACPYPAA